MRPLVNKRHRKRGNDEAEAKASPKVLRKDHAAVRPAQSTLGGKSLAPIGLDAGSTFSTPATHDAPTAAKSIFQENGHRDPYRKYCYHECTRPVLRGESGVRKIDLFPIRGRVAMRYLSAGVGRDQQLPPGHPGRVPRHGRSYSTTRVAMGSQLRLRFKKEVRLLKKATAKIARRDQRIQARKEEIKKLDQEIKSLRAVKAEVHGLHNQTKNLKTLLEAEVDMKKAAEAKNVELAKELESLRIQFPDLQVSNNQLSQQ
nr:hypothetical protein [Tanacetum cinerariifolium]